MRRSVTLPSLEQGPKIVRALPCVLQPSEVDDLARQNAATVSEYTLVEVHKKDVTAKLTGQMKRLREEMDRLAECVTTGFQKRPVDCYWRFHRSRGQAELVRTDTMEIVESREMTEKELQISLSLTISDNDNDTEIGEDEA